jgi:outer membrane lipoprotein-sorting protein
MRLFWIIVLGFSFAVNASSFAQELSPAEMRKSLEFMAEKEIEMTDDEKKSLNRIEKYLTGLTSVMSDFIQVSPAGDLAAGKFYLMRPGKLRLQYDPPTPILMVTAGDYLVYYDYELKQVNYIDMDDTLIGFLARSEVRFDDTVKVIDLTKASGSLRVTLIQAKRPKDGMLTLEFADNPLSLRNVVITDSAGQKTTMSLNNAKFGIALDEELFKFKDPNLGGNKRQKKKLPQ